MCPMIAEETFDILFLSRFSSLHVQTQLSKL